MRRPTNTRARRRQAGFTMAEILVTLVVFSISVVGLVAMESRGIDAQRASIELRGAERLAQEVLDDTVNMGYAELVEFNFAGAANPNFPYDDEDDDVMRALNSVPHDGTNVDDGVRSRGDFFRVIRTISGIPDGINPGGDPDALQALQIQVDVMWIDTSNPQFPPPAGEAVEDLELNNLLPGHADFKPYVRGVRLRRVLPNNTFEPVAAP